MHNKIDYEVLLRFITGKCSLKEKEQIEEWLLLDHANSEILEVLRSSKSAISEYSDNINIEKAWEKLENKIQFNNSSLERIKQEAGKTVSSKKQTLFKLNKFRLVRYAAAVLLAVSIPYIYTLTMNQGTTDERNGGMNEVFVESGKQANITLPDGTTIKLDAGSSIKYPKNFNESTREVYLSGEGYFDVARNEEKPFKINTKNAVIQVLGTIFNVRSWSVSDIVKVAVVEGKVSLRSNIRDIDDEAIITAGYVSTLDIFGILTSPEKTDPVKHTKWMEFEMSFEDAPLKEIFNQLERWYGLDIKVNDDAILQERIKLYIPNRPIEGVLDLISKMLGIQYELSGKNVLFK